VLLYAHLHMAMCAEESMVEPMAYTIDQACEAARSCKSVIYAAIRTGELRAVKRGRRTLVLAVDLRQWVELLPTVRPVKAGHVSVAT
jgi:excisionase family DNA binding protein